MAKGRDRSRQAPKKTQSAQPPPGVNLPITLSPEEAAVVLIYAIARRAALDIWLIAKVVANPRAMDKLARSLNLGPWECMWGLAVALADCVGFLAFDPLGRWGWAHSLAGLLEAHVLRWPVRFLEHHEPHYAHFAGGGYLRDPIHVPGAIRAAWGCPEIPVGGGPEGHSHPSTHSQLCV